MAFYTSRVDDEGNEIERRLSARSTASTMPSGKTRLLSSGSQDHSCRMDNKITYVNPAAFIERNTTDRSGSCSVDDALQLLNAAETQSNNSNIVPPLDLQSEDSFPTHRDYTFSYRKHVVSSNKIDPEVAYKEWLSAKRKVKSDEAARRKQIEEEKRKEQEQRKEKAKEEYQRWLEKKAARKAAEQAEAEMQALKQVKIKKIASAAAVANDAANALSEQEAQARLIQWEHQKRLQEEKRRLLKRQEQEQQREQEEQRRRMAAEAWERWSATASKKPKPVPLNRGFFTLRGTISDIYVNPNEWQNIVPEEKSN